MAALAPARPALQVKVTMAITSSNLLSNFEMNTSDPQAVGEENNCKAQQNPIVPFAVDILGKEKFLAEVEADALFIYFYQEPAMCVC